MTQRDDVRLPTSEEVDRWEKWLTVDEYEDSAHFSCGAETHGKLIFAAREAIRLTEERKRLEEFWRGLDGRVPGTTGYRVTNFLREGHPFVKLLDGMTALLDAIRDEEETRE